MGFRGPPLTWVLRSKTITAHFVFFYPLFTAHFTTTHQLVSRAFPSLCDHMTKTVEQKIAEAESRLARLRQQKSTKDTRRKIIVGALIIAEAMKDPAAARKLCDLIAAKVTRDVDKADIATLVAELSRVQTTPRPE